MDAERESPDGRPAGRTTRTNAAQPAPHRDRQLASAARRLALPEQIADYFHLRYLAYLEWLEDGATSNRLIYPRPRVTTSISASTGRSSDADTRHVASAFSARPRARSSSPAATSRWSWS